jgi:hypothetical protein
MVQQKMADLVEDTMRDAMRLSPEYETEGYQTYHMEVWCEKGSMGFIIDPICRRMGATYQPLVGQASVEKVNLLAKRAAKAAEAGKKVRIWYIADWDRYGWSMVTAVARKLEFMLIDAGIDADVKLTRLALNEDQIDKWNLPKAPKGGEAVVELDALEAIYPGELSNVIREALLPYMDFERPEIVRQENDRIRSKLREILEEKLRPVLEQALSSINVDGVSIDPLECVDKEFEVPEREHEVEEDEDEWIFDSNRDWFEQLDRFMQYKGEREEEAM